MKVLVADDSRTTRMVLRTTLEDAGYEVIEAADGQSALKVLTGSEAPKLAVIDWIMPGLSGVEVCRRLRENEQEFQPYILLLTVRSETRNILEGFRAGVDDYLSKPFDPDELRARVYVGGRIVRLQQELRKQVRELIEASGRVEKLEGMLPICSYCKKIRDDRNYWNQVETYLAERTQVKFTHGICPECIGKALAPRS